MQTHWLKRNGEPSLAIFVLGWASDYHAIEHLSMDGWDVLAVYDLRKLTAMDLPEGYEQVNLYAWSFGVWAAEIIFAGRKFHEAVALNGTPFPVDDRRGIEPRRMALTLRSIRSQGTEKFFRRTYGDYYEIISRHLPPRPEDILVEELEYLCKKSVEFYDPSIDWNRAIVGSEDIIFAPENMLAYWGNRAQMLPLPHYPFRDAENFIGKTDK